MQETRKGPPAHWPTRSEKRIEAGGLHRGDIKRDGKDSITYKSGGQGLFGQCLILNFALQRNISESCKEERGTEKVFTFGHLATVSVFF